MARVIVKLGTQYLEWSTIVDAPVTYLLTREQLREYLVEEHGERDTQDTFDARMERVESTGCSSHWPMTKEGLISSNRAGENRAHLATEAELIARYTYKEGTCV